MIDFEEVKENIFDILKKAGAYKVKQTSILEVHVMVASNEEREEIYKAELEIYKLYPEIEFDFHCSTSPQGE